jgi:hypothetical protein
MTPQGVRRRRDSIPRANWSLVVPIIGWMLNVVVLLLSQHFGNFSTIAGINESNKAGVAAFFIAAAVDGVFGVAGILLAISAKRIIRSSGDDAGNVVATIGVIFSAILIGFGVVMFLAGVFVNALGSMTF